MQNDISDCLKSFSIRFPWILVEQNNCSYLFQQHPQVFCACIKLHYQNRWRRCALISALHVWLHKHFSLLAIVICHVLLPISRSCGIICFRMELTAILRVLLSSGSLLCLWSRATISVHLKAHRTKGSHIGTFCLRLSIYIFSVGTRTYCIDAVVLMLLTFQKYVYWIQEHIEVC